jgi:SAM-dependent methyltransferase
MVDEVPFSHYGWDEHVPHTQAYLLRPLQKLLNALTPSPPTAAGAGLQVLDLGCGNGALAFTGKLDAHFIALWDGGHIKFWSRRTLTSLLEEAGFETVAFRGAGRCPWLWNSMLLAAHKPLV